MKLEVGAQSDLGKRKQTNEDNYATYLPGDSGLGDLKDGGLLALADGLGGHFAGEVASKLAVTIMQDFLRIERDESSNIPRLLVETATKANAQIHGANRGLKGFFRPMGTTLTSVFVEGDKAYFCHVGDSRGYLLRGSEVEQVTQDHSWVDEQVRLGLMTVEEARRDPRRNVLTRTLGTRPETQIEAYERVLFPGDILVLCSDGLSNMVRDEEILQTCTEAEAPQDAAEELVDLANERGAPDNVTAVVAVVEPSRSQIATKKLRRSAKQAFRTALKTLLIAAAIIAIFLLGYYAGQIN